MLCCLGKMILSTMLLWMMISTASGQGKYRCKNVHYDSTVEPQLSESLGTT